MAKSKRVLLSVFGLLAFAPGMGMVRRNDHEVVAMTAADDHITQGVEQLKIIVYD